HLNIFNSHALSQYKDLGCEGACLSVELSYNQIKSLQKSIQTGILAYGRTPLMTYRNCIIKENHGCDKNCENGIFLKDRKNESFLILKDKNSGRQVCGNCLYNAKTMVLAGEREYLNIGIDFIMLNFTLENE